MNICLIGYMGSGKSTLGRKLGKETGRSFLDFDAYIEEREGKTIPEIFKGKGEIYFRKIEADYLDTMLLAHKDAIIALGGGTPCYGNNMQRLKQEGIKTVYLNVPVATLTKRLWKERAQRPVLNDQDTLEKLEEFIRKHLFERSFYYNQADERISVKDQSERELIDDLKARLF
ncbi:MAG: shikimate kinase [Leeuwenhoekiella sp.]